MNQEVNGVSNDEEDSNHSQQSLDSVGGMKPAHLAAKENPIKEEPSSNKTEQQQQQQGPVKPLENGINGKHDDATEPMEVQVKGGDEVTNHDFLSRSNM